MIETTPNPENTLSNREYIEYKSAVRDFALSCVFASNVLYQSSIKAETARPLGPITSGDIDKQLALRETATAFSDRFFRFASIFHFALGNHDTARVWAQHIYWPFRRFDAILFLAENEKRLGKDTRETVQSARDSLDHVPMVASLKPQLAANWARMAPYAGNVEKSPTICLDTAKFILASLPPKVALRPRYGEEGPSRQDSLNASIARAYLVLAEMEGKLGFNFESSLDLASEYAWEVVDGHTQIDIFLRMAVVKRNIKIQFTDSIEDAKRAALNLPEHEHIHKIVVDRLLDIAKVELDTGLNPEETIEVARRLSFNHKKPTDAFWTLIRIAKFEKKIRFDAAKTLHLARQTKQRFENAEWDGLEKVIMDVERMKRDDEHPVDGYYIYGKEIIADEDQALERVNESKDPLQKWYNMQILIDIQVKKGIPPARSFKEAEVIVSSFEVGYQAHCLLTLAQLAAKAGMDPMLYTDKVRRLLYQRMIKSYRTSEIFNDLAKTEAEVAHTLMRRCYPILAHLGPVEIEELTSEAVRLNDQDCIKGLGAFLPLNIQDRFMSDETKNLLLTGRTMRGIW